MTMTHFQTRAAGLASPARTLTAFCASCPDPEAVGDLLQALSFRLSFFLPADEAHASQQDLPALPAQYHFEDEVGTQVQYLAGRDWPCLADDEDDELEGSLARYPVHASRFWLIPGGYELATKRVEEALAHRWNLGWQDLHLVESATEAA